MVVRLGTLLGAAAALALTLAPAARAQTAEDYMRGFDDLNARMAQGSNQIVGQYANDPRVQQMYVQAQQQGYGGSYEQFIMDQVQSCWGQCVGQAMADNNQMRNNERQSLMGLREAEGNFGDSIQERNDHANNNRVVAGGNNVGVMGVYNPETRQTDLRPYIQPGEPFATNNPNWRTDPQGRPCLLNPATGWCQYPNGTGTNSPAPQ